MWRIWTFKIEVFFLFSLKLHANTINAVTFVPIHSVGAMLFIFCSAVAFLVQDLSQPYDRHFPHNHLANFILCFTWSYVKSTGRYAIRLCSRFVVVFFFLLYCVAFVFVQVLLYKFVSVYFSLNRFEFRFLSTMLTYGQHLY